MTVKRADDFVCVPVWYRVAQSGTSGISGREIARALLISHDSANRRLDTLRAKGYVVKNHARRWVSIVRLAPTDVKHDPTLGLVDVPTKKEFGPFASVPEPPTAIPEPPLSERAEVRAEMLAKQLGVPKTVNGKTVTLGPVRPCAWCKALTPLKYGLSPTCKNCAGTLNEKERQ
jgi:biotin operon repressor